jgi:hypothetical protein
MGRSVASNAGVLLFWHRKNFLKYFQITLKFAKTHPITNPDARDCVLGGHPGKVGGAKNIFKQP